MTADTNTTRVNWRDLDMMTAAGIFGLNREIAARRGMDFDALRNTMKHIDWWTDSVNHALKLPVEHETDFALSRHRLALDPHERYQCEIDDRDGNIVRECGATPAVAIVRAWLAWHDAAHPEGEDDRDDATKTCPMCDDSDNPDCPMCFGEGRILK